MTFPMTLAGNLPGGTANGLDDLRDDLLAHQLEPRMCIAMVNVKGFKHDTDTGEETPTIRVLAIEPLAGEAKTTAERLFREAYADRTGEHALPFDEIGQDGDQDEADAAAADQAEAAAASESDAAAEAGQGGDQIDPDTAAQLDAAFSDELVDR